MPPIEVDMDYLWALEVLACAHLDGLETPPEDDRATARRIVAGESLTQPMDRR